MRTRAALLAMGAILVSTLCLSGCVRAVYEDSPSALEGLPTPLLTPIFAFEVSPEPTTSEPALPPSLYFQPSVANLAVGETVGLNVWLDGARQIAALRLELSFNPDYVQVDDADPATDGTQIAPGTVFDPLQAARNEVTTGDNGRIVYEVALAPGGVAQESGILASVTLRGAAEGGSPLRFEQVEAFDAAGNALEIIPLSDGLITVSAVADGGDEPAPTLEPTTGADVGPTAQPTEAPTAAVTPVPTAAPVTSPAPATATGIYYVVQPGENLFRIGANFGVTAQAIAAASNIADPNQVQAGAMVLVPVRPPQGSYGYYVQPHDTVYSIARRFGIGVDQLVTLNRIGADYSIQVGQILVVRP